MTVTSGWVWKNVQRARDYSVSSTSVSFRENWILTRSRISNDEYKTSAGVISSSGDLGNTATALIAMNGGVQETINTPTYESMEFTYRYNSEYCTLPLNVPFYKTGYTRNGRAVYYFTQPTLFHATKATVMFYEPTSYNGNSFYWHITLCTTTEASVGTFPNASTAYSASNLIAGKLADTLTPDGDLWYQGAVWNWAANQWRAIMSPSSYSSALPFVCISDNQTFADVGVDWYYQDQVWVLKTAWN